MKSPLTGKEMKLMSEPSTLDYKGKTYNVIHHYYLCELTNEQFTTTELDEINLLELNKQVKLDFLEQFVKDDGKDKLEIKKPTLSRFFVLCDGLWFGSYSRNIIIGNSS